MPSSSTSRETPPGPPRLRFLGWHGNALRFRRDPIGYMQLAQARYGSVVRFQNDRPDLVFLFGPENLREILDHPDLYASIGLGFPSPKDTSQARIAAGIFGLNGAEHRDFRAAIAPAFSAKVVHGYFPELVVRVRHHLNQWQQLGAPVNLQTLMSGLTVELVALSFFGIGDFAWAHRLAAMIEHWILSCTNFWSRFISCSVPGSPRRRALNQAAAIEAFIRSYLTNYRPQDAAAANLSAILSGGCPVAQDSGSASIEGQFNILFAASHDTTTSALTWTLFLLAQHPDVAHSLLDELQTLRDPGAPSLEELQALPLLDRVIKESLRILPPVVFSSRRTREPVVVDGYSLPRGTVVTFSPFVAHHAPQVFDQPMRFKPERWEKISPSSYEYLPFGAGRRRCIGAAFATMALKLVVAMTLARFRITVAPGAKIDHCVRVTLRAKAGVPVILTRQDGGFRCSPVRGTINDVVALAPG